MSWHQLNPIKRIPCNLTSSSFHLLMVYLKRYKLHLPFHFVFQVLLISLTKVRLANSKAKHVFGELWDRVRNFYLWRDLKIYKLNSPNRSTFMFKTMDWCQFHHLKFWNIGGKCMIFIILSNRECPNFVQFLITIK